MKYLFSLDGSFYTDKKQKKIWVECTPKDITYKGRSFKVLSSRSERYSLFNLFKRHLLAASAFILTLGIPFIARSITKKENALTTAISRLLVSTQNFYFIEEKEGSGPSNAELAKKYRKMESGDYSKRAHRAKKLARIYLRKGQLDNCSRALEKMRLFSPAQNELKKKLIEAYINKRDYEQAASILKSLLYDEREDFLDKNLFPIAQTYLDNKDFGIANHLHEHLSMSSHQEKKYKKFLFNYYLDHDLPSEAKPFLGSIQDKEDVNSYSRFACISIQLGSGLENDAISQIINYKIRYSLYLTRQDIKPILNSILRVIKNQNLTPEILVNLIDMEVATYTKKKEEEQQKTRGSYNSGYNTRSQNTGYSRPQGTQQPKWKPFNPFEDWANFFNNFPNFGNTHGYTGFTGGGYTGYTGGYKGFTGDGYTGHTGSSSSNANFNTNHEERKKLEKAYKTFSANASTPIDEIKKKYKKFALTMHPDKVSAEPAATYETRRKQAEEKFKQMGEDYSLILESRGEVK